MRLVFVHGMRQERKDPVALRNLWEEALTDAWRRTNLALPAYELEMPFYGDKLHEETERLRGSASAIVSRGSSGPGVFGPVEEELIREIGRLQGVTDADIRLEVGAEVVTRGPANWEWIQAIGRLLERRVPTFRSLGLSFVRQVDAYLTRDHVTRIVDDIVRPALQGGPAVVVAHSLGSIVAYRNLRALGQVSQVPLLVTLGSPLGINAVKDRIRPPRLRVPEGVVHWINGTDERDYVALYARLGGEHFTSGIEDIPDIHNRPEDAHFIADYLAHPTVALRIHAALFGH